MEALHTGASSVGGDPNAGGEWFSRKKVGIEREQIWGQSPCFHWWRWEYKWWGQIRAESQLSWRGWSAA